MKISHVGGSPSAHSTPLLAVALGKKEAANGELSGPLAELAPSFDSLAAVLASGEFAGGPKEELVLYPNKTGEQRGLWGAGPERLLLLGAGDDPGNVPEAMDRQRGAAARAVRTANRLRLPSLTISVLGASGEPVLGASGEPALDLSEEPGPDPLAQAAAEGAALANWRYDELKSGGVGDDEARSSVASVEIWGGGRESVQRGAILGEAANFARTLQSRPGNVATPAAMARAAEEMADEAGLGCEIFDEARLRREGMEAILAVSRGSVEEARLIVLEHGGGRRGEPPLALVGKGLSFDAGGISLKPAARMEEMKYDMSGGAAVIAAMKAVAELGLPLNVLGVVPASENLPSGSAVKPGDVINTLAGKTVEVINTDAEGRLILADALAYVSARDPSAIVDCATLTGAAVVALGHHASAVLGNNDDLACEVEAAGERSGESCWKLPLWPAYRKQLESRTADIKNVGGRPAGTITAAAFLAEFVGEGVPWAHIDIAGTAYGKAEKPYQSRGPHGTPTRLLVEWVIARS